MRPRSIMFPALAAAQLAWLLAGCAGSGTRDECQKDGDCPPHWKCDTYGKFCRCVSDEGCDTAAGERCMPDGTCQVYTGCSTDADCASLERCDPETGECLCTSSEACPEGQVCNASGYCQPSSGCFDNDDCADGEICDTPSKTCIPAGTCTNKYQCPLGQICHNQTCIDGCEDHGDCPYRWACIQGNCVEGVCEDDSFCDFMEYCRSGECRDAYDEEYAPYCKPCDGVDLLGCGQRNNPCLIYPYMDDAYYDSYPYSLGASGEAQYCAVDCSEGQRCPNGFECSSVITVKASDICESDADCPGDLPCLKSQEEAQGFCPCHDGQNPCMDNACMPGYCIMGSCVAYDLPCQQDEDCSMCQVTKEHCATDADCPAVPCEKFEDRDYGGCVSAKGCGLREGFHCPAP